MFWFIRFSKLLWQLVQVAIELCTTCHTYIELFMSRGNEFIGSQ